MKTESIPIARTDVSARFSIRKTHTLVKHKSAGLFVCFFFFWIFYFSIELNFSFFKKKNHSQSMFIIIRWIIFSKVCLLFFFFLIFLKTKTLQIFKIPKIHKINFFKSFIFSSLLNNFSYSTIFHVHVALAPTRSSCRRSAIPACRRFESAACRALPPSPFRRTARCSAPRCTTPLRSAGPT